MRRHKVPQLVNWGLWISISILTLCVVGGKFSLDRDRGGAVASYDAHLWYAWLLLVWFSLLLVAGAGGLQHVRRKLAVVGLTVPLIVGSLGCTPSRPT